MIIRLEAMRGPVAGRLFTFDEPDIFVFGRDGDVQCSIPTDKGISRKHFMLQVSPPDCFVTDLGSFNGTKVNDTLYGGRSDNALRYPRRAAAGPVKLKHNDMVVAGLSQFRVDITYDFTCASCGVLFIVRGDDAAMSVGTNPLCDECRRLSTAPSAGSITRLLRCSRCGGDVSAEAGVRGFDPEVEYVCSKCRASTLRGSDILRVAHSRVALSDGAPAIEFGEDVPEPPPIDGYEHLRLIGVGGMGAVYLSRKLDTGDLVAIKMMLPEVAVRKEAAAVFERETAVAASLAHPNVVRIYQRGRVGAIFYFVMEYVEGTDADSLTADLGGRVPLDMATEIVLQALDGLAHAHEQGYVHRDVKPANILIEGKGAVKRVVLSDFGLAKSFEQAGLSGLTTGSTPRGSLFFMPREQITHFRWVRPTCDVYAMGATFYYMLTGMPARRGLEPEDLDLPAAVRAITTEAPVKIRSRDPSVPRSLAAVIDRSLHDDEGSRYKHAGSMRRAMLRALGPQD